MKRWISGFLCASIILTAFNTPVWGNENQEIIEDSSSIAEEIEEMTPVIPEIPEEESSEVIDSEIPEEESSEAIDSEIQEEVGTEDTAEEEVVEESGNEKENEVTEEESEAGIEEKTEEVPEEIEEETEEESSIIEDVHEKPEVFANPVYEADERTQELLDLQNEMLEYGGISAYSLTDLSFEKQLAAFPESYKPYLRALHEKYPNWGFEAVETGLEWSTAVSKECQDERSLIYSTADALLKSNKSGDYNATTGNYIAKDGSSWFTASRAAVAYYMDPRNFLNEQYIMMFEANTYDKAYHKLSGVEAILKGTFMEDTSIDYLDAEGNTISLEETYGETIWGAGVASNVSPLYLASKIRQEVGGTNKSGSVSGKYGNYPGIYNYYNIGAYSGSDPISNGLKWASNTTATPKYSRPWTSPVLSIYGGAEYIGSSYILKGQNTGYYMRFNVSPESAYTLYSHQYMTNISGAASEAKSVYSSYKNLGILADAKVFYIPVYENMPDTGVDVLFDTTVRKGTNEYAVNVRKEPSTKAEIVVTANAGTTMTVSGGIICSAKDDINYMLSNPYWYKVQFTQDGKTYSGYISARYINMNSAYTVTAGNTKQLQLKNGTTETIYYETSNPAVATVSDTGVVTGISEGKANIYAISGNGEMDAIGITISKQNGYTVTLNANGGTVSSKTIQYASGAKMGTLPTPTRKDYVFQGWYTAKTGGTKVTASTTVTKNRTLYAQWKKSINASTITVGSVSKKIYRGTAFVPKPAVKDNGVKLVRGTDYKITYSNNMNPGTATLTITGIGDYAGTRKITFKIGVVTNRHITTGNVNYRKGPGLSYARVGTLKKGTYVQVVYNSQVKADDYNWKMIKIDGQYYWTAGEYLELSQTLQNYVVTKNVNYRLGPGTGYLKEGTLKQGTRISVVKNYSSTSNGITWFKIKMNGKYYFVSSSYVTKESLVSYTTQDNLNYRNGPGLSYSVVGTIPYGNTVKVLNGYSKKADGYTWYMIKKDNTYYYAVSMYLKKSS